ncbi:MAG: ammonium transporter, partial [Candidatus Dadabacteria bacterium]
MNQFVRRLKGISTNSVFLPILILLLLISVSSYAQEDAGPTPAYAIFVSNNIWMLLATFLVFLMHLGFAMVESGLTRANNTTNILFKNTSVVAIGL